MLPTARVALFAWSWRRPLLAIAAALLGLPVLMAGMVVQAQQGHVGPLLTPVNHATLTQPFGCTTLEIEPLSEACAGRHFHSGIDLAAPLDTPIHAATGGVVAIHRERGGYGLYILVVHDPQLSTLYGHLDWPLVQPGEVVTAGQAIALMGSTGNSTGPHLHFEVRIACIPVDPLPLLASRRWSLAEIPTTHQEPLPLWGRAGWGHWKGEPHGQQSYLGRSTNA